MHADWKEYRRLKPYLAPYAARLGVILGINVLATALGLAQPYISKLLIDNGRSNPATCARCGGLPG